MSKRVSKSSDVDEATAKAIQCADRLADEAAKVIRYWDARADETVTKLGPLQWRLSQYRIARK